MKPKPAHLGPEYAAQFSDQSVVSHYCFRPQYPEGVFGVLQKLVVDDPRVMLDVGTGTGEIARQMTKHVDRIDAIDASTAMISEARRLPGGDSDRIFWRVGFAETVPLNPPYALITAGASLHWMDWSIVLPRFCQLLSSSGVVAIVENREIDVPWQASLQRIISRYSTNRHFRPYNLVEELEDRELFKTLARIETSPAPYSQHVAEYVASFHARNGFSLDRMAPEAAEAFDREVTALVISHVPDGLLTLQIAGEVVWGMPLPSRELA
jgi:ubiquinone/menaquinone biosynthesis C-methylase UbiE